MQLSVATATLYKLPFEQVLEIIAMAGFQNIELDLYWERKEWAMAQHLREVPAKRAVRLVEQSGLRISSIHDGGGVLEEEGATKGFINPVLDEYLSEMGYAPDCLVFHTPHMEGQPTAGWWGRISDKIVRSLEKYREMCSFVTIENMPHFEGYCVPLTSPEELNAFVTNNDLSVTIDTTHYAQMGIDIVAAAMVLAGKIKTIHLSDFLMGEPHIFVGEGELDLPSFFAALDKESLNSITLECSLATAGHPRRDMYANDLIGRMAAAKVWLEGSL